MNGEKATAELKAWWVALAAEEADKVAPKAIEYGSTDLIDIGRVMGTMMGRRWNEREMAEAGIMFYLEGKMARWRGALADGRAVSDDTLFDIGVYSRMAQRNRSHGGWPGTTHHNEKSEKSES